MDVNRTGLDVGHTGITARLGDEKIDVVSFVLSLAWAALGWLCEGIRGPSNIDGVRVLAENFLPGICLLPRDVQGPRYGFGSRCASAIEGAQNFWKCDIF
jgi:hypothetical protein